MHQCFPRCSEMSATIFTVSGFWGMCMNRFAQPTSFPHVGSSCHCSDVEAEEQDGKGEKQQGTRGVLAVCRRQLTAAEVRVCWLSAAPCAHPCSPSAAGTEAIVCLTSAPALLLGRQHPGILSYTSFPILTNTLTV